MPIYTYYCNSCLSKTDFLIGVGQGKVKIVCPECGSKDLKKVFSPFRVSGTKSSSKCLSCSGGDCSSC
ncbi:MAG: zinc ribbon domain-containing protein [Candidatus Omnitrophica bacterium]|nr:zinc ribbon domain-containing protein [Candidatus Omnitrophota bacterium]MDD5430065.1 zinc ribbon domain-containing protein [Candidatus Omnitrophota bacterium]